MVFARKKEKENSQTNTATVYKNFPLIKKYFSQSGEVVQVIKPLLIDRSEFKDLLKTELANLKIKTERVENYLTNNTETKRDIIIHLKDSILNDTLRKFEYIDRWDSITILDRNKSVQLHYSISDTVTYIIYKGRRKHPYLWFFSPRQIEVAFSNKNPHVKIKGCRAFIKQ